MRQRIWILGAADPEMSAIENLLRSAGEEVHYSVQLDGNRVHPGNAYRAAQQPTQLFWDNDSGETLYFVECLARVYGSSVDAVYIDHHRPVVIVDGDCPPRALGEAPYHTFRRGFRRGQEGGVCHNPGAALRAGHRLNYHRSTHRVEVGAEYLAAECELLAAA